MCVRDLLLHFSVHLTKRECDVGWKGSCEAQEWDLYFERVAAHEISTRKRSFVKMFNE